MLTLPPSLSVNDPAKTVNVIAACAEEAAITEAIAVDAIILIYFILHMIIDHS